MQMHVAAPDGTERRTCHAKAPDHGYIRFGCHDCGARLRLGRRFRCSNISGAPTAFALHSGCGLRSGSAYRTRGRMYHRKRPTPGCCGSAGARPCARCARRSAGGSPGGLRVEICHHHRWNGRQRDKDKDAMLTLLSRDGSRDGAPYRPPRDLRNEVSRAQPSVRAALRLVSRLRFL